MMNGPAFSGGADETMEVTMLTREHTLFTRKRTVFAGNCCWCARRSCGVPHPRACPEWLAMAVVIPMSAGIRVVHIPFRIVGPVAGCRRCRERGRQHTQAGFGQKAFAIRRFVCITQQVHGQARLARMPPRTAQTL